MIKTVSVQELCEQLDTDPQTVLIDLRAPKEFQQGHVQQACNIPVGSVPLHEIVAEWGREPEGKPIYFICQSGARSQQLLADLEDMGFHSAQCVAGGMVAWNAVGLPVVAGQKCAVSAKGCPLWAQIVAALLVLAGCGLGLFIHKGFFSIPVLVALAMLFSGLTGWPGPGSVFGRKGRAD